MKYVAGWVVALLVATGIGVAIVAGVWSPNAGGSLPYGSGMLRNVECVDSGPSPSCGGLVPASPALSDHIVLNATQVVAGQPLLAALVVTNDSGRRVKLNTGRCLPVFEVALTNDRVAPQVSFLTKCVARDLFLDPGVTRFTFQVLTTYAACRQGPAPRTLPRCVGSAPPPLPAGAYVAVLLGNGEVALPPATASVTVLAPG